MRRIKRNYRSLMVLYLLLKNLFRFAIKQYFREIKLHKPQVLLPDGPEIVLPNHNSAFLDPIVVAALYPRSFYFLARGESFQNPLIARLFKILHMIPVYRPETIPEKVGENEAIFTHCFELLEKNKSLLIFPEGICQNESRLMPLKTGAARIALGAAARNNFRLNVRLLPVGINYTNSHAVQGKLFVNYGSYLETANYQRLYEEDPVQAVKALTADVEKMLGSLIIRSENEADVHLARRVDELLRVEAAALTGKSPGPANWYISRQEILHTLSKMRQGTTSVDMQNFERRVAHFYRLAKTLHFRRRLLNPLGKHQRSPRHWGIVIYFLLFAPVFLLGLAAHFLPWKLTESFSRIIVRSDDFRGSVLLVSGVLFFLIFLIAEMGLLYLLGVQAPLLWLYVPLFPMLGLATFRYWIRLRRLLDIRYLWKYGARGRGYFSRLKAERQALVAQFLQARYESTVD